MEHKAYKLPTNLDELFKFSADFTNLKTTLEFLAEWSHRNSEDNKATNELLEQTSSGIKTELLRLPHIESIVASSQDSLLHGLSEIQHLSVRTRQDKVTAWSERFITLEERLFTVDNELRQELQTVSEAQAKAEARHVRELQVAKAALESEFRSKLEVGTT
jgi:hypothetical protein